MVIDIPHKLSVVLILTVGLSLAAAFGYLFQRLKLSPIIGFLLAGYSIGPFSPGFVADTESAEQLAEIGVILMMFGVGMHFKWQDLVGVKNIAIPGAIVQTFFAAAGATGFMYALGWPLQAGVIMGFAIGVASTVVLVRVLADNDLLHTQQGHIAVGWLIVEDFLTVAVLILLPTFTGLDAATAISWPDLFVKTGMVLLNFVLMALLMLTVGLWLVRKILTYVARTRSDELFTLTVLALTFVVALGSSIAFGTSIALGAFIAGMVIGQTDARHQALANSLPLKDLFGAIFFLAVGMLFNPHVLANEWKTLIGILLIILVLKPLVAFAFTRLFRYPASTAIVVGLALGQIGEFSFILSEQAMKLDIFPDEGFDIVVACAIISIALNPLLFRIYASIQGKHVQRGSGAIMGKSSTQGPKAIVVGFGPMGQETASTLTQLGYSPMVIDRNIDTVGGLSNELTAVFGDASTSHILKTAGVAQAELLVITVPDIAVVTSVAKSARRLNPKIRILARVQYKKDKDRLASFKLALVCCEEECAKAFKQQLETHFSFPK